MSSVFNDPKWVDVDVEGEFTKRKYFGRFYIKPYLNHAEKSDAARLAEIYTRGISKNEHLVSFLTTLAYLKFYIVETDAKWWEDEYGNNGMETHDESPIWELSSKLGEIRSPAKEKDTSVKPKSE